MIGVSEYFKEVLAKGTPEAQMLLRLEACFAGTEADAIAEITKSYSARTELTERLLCLLIAHRSLVIVNYLMEQGRGFNPANAADLGPVVPDNVIKPDEGASA